jgi:transcriptional regulator ATRX
MSSIKDNYGRAAALEDWMESGGIMIIGYDMYRNLSTHKNIRKKKLKDTMTKTLVNPGL